MGFRVREIKTDLAHRLVAENEDACGYGWRMFILKDFKAITKEWEDERPLAWCYAAELSFPPWIEHRGAHD